MAFFMASTLAALSFPSKASFISFALVALSKCTIMGQLFSTIAAIGTLDKTKEAEHVHEDGLQQRWSQEQNHHLQVSSSSINVI